MDKDQKIDLLKGAVGFIAGIGTSIIVNGTVQNQCYGAHPIQKPFIWVAKFGLSSALAEVAKKHTDAQIDEIVKAIDAYRNPEVADG